MIQRPEIHTLNRVNLYERVADHLEQMILNSDESQWGEGEQLPPEQELADEFGVSRNVVREAIKLLKERGLADPKNGVGVYITRPDAQKFSALMYRYVLMNGIDVSSIYDTRILLEKHNARLAAGRCTEENLEKMRMLLARLEDRTISVNERREADYQFHVEIAEAAGNPINVFLTTAMKDIFIAMIEKGIFNHGGIEDACKRHSRIMAALEAHDSEEAAAAMEDHLIYSYEQVQKYNGSDGRQ